MLVPNVAICEDALMSVGFRPWRDMLANFWFRSSHKSRLQAFLRCPSRMTVQSLKS